MALDMSSDRVVCHRCGKAFSKRQGNFHTSYAQLHKGVGCLPICKSCVDSLYLSYLTEYDDAAKAIKRVCRKLDLYWSENIYKALIKKNGEQTLMSAYLARLTIPTNSGKSYDDTIEEERQKQQEDIMEAIVSTPPVEEVEPEVDPSLIERWGTGYSPDMYQELEQRYAYWKNGLPPEYNVVASDAIIKQICGLEMDITKIRAAGGDPSKLITTLNTLIGSLNLKPSQKQDDNDSDLANTPLGLWLYRYENERPLPQVEDENVIRKTVFTWMGHVCKMLGKKNAYSKLYEDEIARLRVEKPEYDGDDEEFMMDVLSEEVGYSEGSLDDLLSSNDGGDDA